jgi:hypothetical protein
MINSRRILTLVQITFLVLALFFSAAEKIYPVLSDLPLALVFFLMGFSATIINFQLQIEALTGDFRLQIDSLAGKHAELMKEMSMLNEIKRYETVFLDDNLVKSNSQSPHLHAFLRTGRSQGVNHAKRMATSFRSMEAQIPVDIEDPRLTEEFLRNLVNAVEDLGPGCVWLGTSLVYRPEGWKTKEIQTFATAIREKALRGKLKVFRLYLFNYSIEGMAEHAKILKREHISVEADHDICVKISEHTSDIGDISLLCLPPKRLLSADSDPSRHGAPPMLSWDQFKEDGWRVVFGLRWEIQDGCDIGRIKVYSGDPEFIEREYKRFVTLWHKGESFKPDPSNQANRIEHR